MAKIHELMSEVVPHVPYSPNSEISSLRKVGIRIRSRQSEEGFADLQEGIGPLVTQVYLYKETM